MNCEFLVVPKCENYVLFQNELAVRRRVIELRNADVVDLVHVGMMMGRLNALIGRRRSAEAMQDSISRTIRHLEIIMSAHSSEE